MPHAGSTALGSKLFRGSWRYIYSPRSHSHGHEPQAPVRSGIAVDATCKECQVDAVADVAQGSVWMKCPRCKTTETVER